MLRHLLFVTAGIAGENLQNQVACQCTEKGGKEQPDDISIRFKDCPLPFIFASAFNRIKVEDKTVFFFWTVLKWGRGKGESKNE